MFKVANFEQLNDDVIRLDIEAPFVAKKAKAGQFVVLRIDEYGERVPFTIMNADPETGLVTIIVQVVGQTTMLLSQLRTGDYIEDFVGPLGKATDFGNAKKACVIGGGVGNAIAYPSAKALHEMGAEVDVIAGFRTKDIIILEDEYKDICDNLYITTDDGSYGEKGFVTDKLQSLIDAGNDYDLVIAIGPVIMMKFVSKVTEPYGIKTLVSLNPIMIDGTGMCGGCRVQVGGEMKFACVDGPDFDGHQVDYDELMSRNATFSDYEAHGRDNCRLFKAAREVK
ncbi:MAG: sulfide/dihydroorotate dehydrogenase-like FAD/NAD-binding protein [Eubacterium sp.]|nr:sulfide/dihydroorotate dehydrogenase-like FAD/NAD-binding protein [Eubacterium sp.]